MDLKCIDVVIATDSTVYACMHIASSMTWIVTFFVVYYQSWSPVKCGMTAKCEKIFCLINVRILTSKTEKQTAGCLLAEIVHSIKIAVGSR